MTKRKSVDNTTVKPKGHMFFLKEASDRSATKMISVRISETLLAEFKEAVQRAEASGFDLSMTSVVQDALQMAVDEARAIPAKQDSLPLSAS